MGNQPEAWDWMKFARGPLEPRNYAKVLVYATCVGLVLLVLSGIASIKEKFFPSKPSVGNASRVKVESGGTAHITNVNYDSRDLKQGIYGELSSKDFGVGVFKEVLPNVDLSIGIEKDFDEEDLEVKVQTRYKF